MVITIFITRRSEIRKLVTDHGFKDAILTVESTEFWKLQPICPQS
jgi:hypothetical protein